MSECPSMLMLARLHADELSANQKAHVFAHIKECNVCGDALAALKKNVGVYEENISHHALMLKDALAGAKSDTGNANNVIRFMKPKQAIILAVSIAAAAVFAIGMFAFWPSQSVSAPDITAKGAFAFSAVVKRDNHQFELQSGNRLQENDVLRFVVQTGSAGYLYIFSMDASDHITSLYPFAEAAQNLPAIPLIAAGQHALDDSIVLDDSRGTEHIIAIFSKSPFTTDLISVQMAKEIVQNIKETGESFKMHNTEWSKKIADASVSVIAIEKK